MKILVTGGAGYIGSHTVAELLEMGYGTVTYDNLQKGHRDAVLGGEFIRGDLRDAETLEKAFRENAIDAVIHFAADSLVGESMQKPQKYFDNNVVSGLSLLGNMVKYSVRKIIFSSTAACYGEPEKVPIDETNSTVPTNPYGESKLIFEKMLRWHDEAYGIKYVSLRYFNAAGAHKSGRIGEDHDPESHLIPIVLKAALDRTRQVSVFGTDYPTKDGTCVRDYIHVTDLALAHILALKKLEEGGKSSIYNLGNGSGFSVKEVIGIAEKVAGCRIKTESSARRPGDPAVLIASSEKIKKELNWNPRYYELETIIRTAWEWHSKFPGGFKK